MKIIDAHVHLVQCIAGTGAGGELRSCGQGRGMYADGSTCSCCRPNGTPTRPPPERILQVMNENGVERGRPAAGRIPRLSKPVQLAGPAKVARALSGRRGL